MSQHFDTLIVGGGQAGVPLAHALASDTHRVGLAERQHLGGTCVNYGCTPTKAVLASARVAHLARRAGDFGVLVPEVSVDFPAVLARAQQIVQDSRRGIEEGFADLDNPTLLRGTARFVPDDSDSFRLRIGEAEVTAARVILNVGARTRIPDIDGLRDVPFLDAGNWLYRPDLPEHLVVIGGGSIGVEMAQFYRRMGSAVTVVQDMDQIVPKEDRDVADAMQKLLKAEGITFRLSTSVTRIASGDGLVVTVEDTDGTHEIAASHLFLAVGRAPNTHDLGLEHVGVKTDDEGFVVVDEHLATSVGGIWAAGDVRGGPMFTHTAWDDHRVILSHLTGDGSHTTDRIVPYGVFTDPALGRVGMTEAAARDAGKQIEVACYAMEKNGKATEIGETEGFIKVIIDADTEQILGAAVLAAEGAELVHAYIDVMNAGSPYTAILDGVHIHPTLSEGLQSVLKELG